MWQTLPNHDRIYSVSLFHTWLTMTAQMIRHFKSKYVIIWKRIMFHIIRFASIWHFGRLSKWEECFIRAILNSLFTKTPFQTVPEHFIIVLVIYRKCSFCQTCQTQMRKVPELCLKPPPPFLFQVLQFLNFNKTVMTLIF